MSETVDLKNVLLNATEATSMADTDRLMAFGSDGGLKKIAKRELKDRFKFQSSEGKWYRVAILGRGGSSSVGSAVFAAEAPEQEAFMMKWSFSRTIGVKKHMVEVFNPTSVYPFESMTKFRIVHPTNTAGKPAYLDIYLQKAKNIEVCIGTSINAEISYSDSPVIESNYAAVEFDLNIFGGGVNISFPMHYKFQQKGGGLRDGRNNGTYQRFAEKSDDRCDGVSWICRRRYRKLQGLWRIPVGCKKHFVHNADSYARMELRLYGGDVSGRRHHAANNPSTRQTYLGQGASSWTVATVVSDYADRGDIIASERRAA